MVKYYVVKTDLGNGVLKLDGTAYEFMELEQTQFFIERCREVTYSTYRVNELNLRKELAKTKAIGQPHRD